MAKFPTCFAVVVVVVLACVAVYSSTAESSISCSSDPVTKTIMKWASDLAAKGFDLTDENLDSCKPNACNAAFKQSYIDGLIKLGKSQADVDEWIKKVYEAGELRPRLHRLRLGASVLACNPLFEAVNPRVVECPPGPVVPVLKAYAFTLATFGFNLTEEDMAAVPVHYRESDEEKKAEALKTRAQLVAEGNACNLMFKNTYIEGLIDLGKTQAEVYEWIKKVYSARGELSPPKRAVSPLPSVTPKNRTSFEWLPGF